MYKMRVQILMGMGTPEQGTRAGHCNVPTHECIAHCSSAAAGEGVCLAQAADELAFANRCREK